MLLEHYYWCMMCWYNILMLWQLFAVILFYRFTQCLLQLSVAVKERTWKWKNNCETSDDTSVPVPQLNLSWDLRYIWSRADSSQESGCPLASLPWANHFHQVSAVGADITWSSKHSLTKTKPLWLDLVIWGTGCSLNCWGKLQVGNSKQSCLRQTCQHLTQI